MCAQRRLISAWASAKSDERQLLLLPIGFITYLAPSGKVFTLNGHRSKFFPFRGVYYSEWKINTFDRMIPIKTSSNKSIPLNKSIFYNEWTELWAKKGGFRTYLDSEGLDQPASPHSMTRDFTVRSQNHWLLYNTTMHKKTPLRLNAS